VEAQRGQWLWFWFTRYIGPRDVKNLEHQSVTGPVIYRPGSHVPDAMVKGTTVYRIIADHLGNVRFVIDSDGNVVQEITYDEFGVVLSDSNEGFQPFGFAGGLYDPETGLVRFGARDYDAAIGRWTSKDPILFAGSQTNLFAYVDNDV
jgi:RHS repeat-associated protein